MALKQRLRGSFECQEKLSVRPFIVDEEISELFRIESPANSTNDDLDLEKFTGRPASCRIMPGPVGLSSPARLGIEICPSVEQV